MRVKTSIWPSAVKRTFGITDHPNGKLELPLLPPAEATSKFVKLTLQSAVLQQLDQILARLLIHRSSSLNVSPHTKGLKACHLIPEHILLWDNSN